MKVIFASEYLHRVIRRIKNFLSFFLGKNKKTFKIKDINPLKTWKPFF